MSMHQGAVQDAAHQTAKRSEYNPGKRINNKHINPTMHLKGIIVKMGKIYQR